LAVIAVEPPSGEASEEGQGPVLIKVGGDLLERPEDRQALAANLGSLLGAGISCVLLHGGGPQVSALQARLGLPERKVGGRRITSPEDLRAVTMALCGELNVSLCASLIAAGLPAFGMHGASGATLQATRRPPRVISSGGDAPIDFGEVGDLVAVERKGLDALLAVGLMPVIATLGVSLRGELFNINADTTAVSLARAMNARCLLLVTRVGGIFRDLGDPSSRLTRLSDAEARALIQEGVIREGMIPKVEEALEVLHDPVDSISVLGVSAPDGFLRALRRPGSQGTSFV